MDRASERRHESEQVGPGVRRRAVPSRQLGDKLVVARPLDGAPVVLAPTATIVWRALADWTTPAAIDLRLAEVFQSVTPYDRESALREILGALTDDDLLERS